jgi:predicted component of type VI protein secretion system
MATLRVISTTAPELEGRSFALGPEGTSLGRDGGNRVVLPEGSVSRRHARIEVVGNVYELVDQRSSNGTFVNDQRVTIHRLVEGDRVRIGHTTLLFEMAGGAAASAARATPPPVAPSQRCAACETESPPGSRFCPGCGQPLPQPATDSAYPAAGAASRTPTKPELAMSKERLERAERGDRPTAPTLPPGPLPPPPHGPRSSLAAMAPTTPEESAVASPTPVAAPRPKGCVIGCALLALVLLVAAAAGGFYVLHREGRVTIPGLSRVEAAPTPAP